MKTKVLFSIFTLLCLVSSRVQRADGRIEAVDYTARGLHVADYLLNQQNADGAIPDAPGAGIVNEESNMESAWEDGPRHRATIFIYHPAKTSFSWPQFCARLFPQEKDCGGLTGIGDPRRAQHREKRHP